MGSAHRASIIWRRTLPRHQFGFPSHPSGFEGPKGTKCHCNVSKNSPDAQNNGIAVGIYSSDIGNLPGRAAKNIQKIAENEASRREPSPDQARENIYNGMQLTVKQIRGFIVIDITKFAEACGSTQPIERTKGIQERLVKTHFLFG